MTAGDQCLEITIEDDGPNDKDSTPGTVGGPSGLAQLVDSDRDGIIDLYDDDDDNDGLTDELEVNTYKTDPLDPDTDNDGIPDGYETQYEFLDPLDDTDAAQDADGDGFSNLEEYRAGSDPSDPDSKPRQVNIIPIITPLLLP